MSNIEEKWYKQALHDDMCLEKLTKFIEAIVDADEMCDDYLIAHAMASACVATAKVINNSKHGPVFNHTRDKAIIEFIRHLKSWGPTPKIINYEGMLYPQMWRNYERTISRETHRWLQKKATENLKTHLDASPEVREHWEKLAKGEIPFGYYTI